MKNRMAQVFLAPVWGELTCTFRRYRLATAVRREPPERDLARGRHDCQVIRREECDLRRLLERARPHQQPHAGELAQVELSCSSNGERQCLTHSNRLGIL